jgi:hypothetical protein
MMTIRERAALIAARNMKKPVTALSILIIAALTIGAAVAERMGQRAQQDRFSFGAEAQR